MPNKPFRNLSKIDRNMRTEKKRVDAIYAMDGVLLSQNE